MRKKYSRLVELARVRVGKYASNDYDPDGMFMLTWGPTQLAVIATPGNRQYPWEHVSVSTPTRCPTWEEMCFVKDLFWDEHEAVIQIHPPKAEYVNHHPHTLHMWRPRRWVDRIKLPPSILVG